MVEITKQTGEKETFDADKLCQSIKEAGASEDIAEHICAIVGESVDPGTTTTKIFRGALRELVKEDIELGARYSLRRGVSALGPAGFIFEQFVEALLQAHDYETKRNVVMKGQCVDHEVDVFAQKGGIRYLVEAKYRNEPGTKTHIDQVMYADARLMDIQRHHEEQGHKEDYIMWVITNTKFTKKAIQYAECRGVKLVGWNYPKDGSLKDMIIHKKMYPITVLPSLTKFARDQFVQHNMVLAQDLLPYTVDDLKNKFGLSMTLAKKLIYEVQEIIN